jgi:DNA-binding SARP family transcriptional activator/TolB-like protein
MLRLRTFGGLSVESDGGPLAGAATQRTRLALLVVLAVAGEPGIARERLLAYFWPESDANRARNSLKQALFALRRDLGEPEVVLGTRQLRLNREVIACDAAEFAEAIAAAANLQAVTRYAGPFLDGVFFAQLPDLERWADDQRTRFRFEWLRAVESLATEAALDDDDTQAAHWWRVLAEAEPFNARIAMSLMRVLAQRGDRGGALTVARDFEARFRAEYGAPPDASVARFAERLRAWPGHDLSGDALPTTALDANPVDDGGVNEKHTIERSLDSPSLPRARWGMNIPRRMIVGAFGLALAGAAVLLTAHRRDAHSSLDAHTVAITPFQVVGSSDLRFLSDAMVDLLAVTLTTDNGLQALDPRASIADWQRVRGNAYTSIGERAAVVGRDLGAAKVVSGSIMGSPSRLIIHAELRDLLSGSRGVGSVEGPRDSLPQLIDRLTAALLVGDAGVPISQRAELGRSKLDMLKEYLAGRAAYRLGRYQQAEGDYLRALEQDSTFLPAAVALLPTVNWTADRVVLLRTARLLYLQTNRLTTRDRLLLAAFAYDAVPRPDGRVPDGQSELLRRDSLVAIAPDNADAWYAYGDWVFHQGTQLGLEDYLIVAGRAFDRALSIDSTFAPALEHRLDVAASGGDSATVRRLAARYLAADPLPDNADYVRWRASHALHDAAALSALRARMDAMNNEVLKRIGGIGQTEGVSVDDAVRATHLLVTHALSEYERAEARGRLCDLHLNLGEARAAAQLRYGGPNDNWTPLVHAIFDDGDTTGIASRVHRPPDANRLAPKELVRAEYDHAYETAMWELYRADTAAAHAAIVHLRRLAPRAIALGFAGRNELRESLALSLIEAWLATLEHRPDARARVWHADSVLRRETAEPSRAEAHLILGQLWSQLGEPVRGLSAARLRTSDWNGGPALLAASLREEGELAATAGDLAASIKAYRHFLALRSHPDAAFMPRIAAVTRQLEAIEGRLSAR